MKRIEEVFKRERKRKKEKINRKEIGRRNKRKKYGG